MPDMQFQSVRGAFTAALEVAHGDASALHVQPSALNAPAATSTQHLALMFDALRALLAVLNPLRGGLTARMRMRIDHWPFVLVCRSVSCES
jgi:hypothetical protein